MRNRLATPLTVAGALALAVPLVAAWPTGDLCDGTAGDGCQDPAPELINGTLVLPSLQKRLGLVTLGAGRHCSGTLLNRFWVLTADHCVAGHTKEDLAVSGRWEPTRIAVPTKVIRYSSSDGLDVAMLFLGAGDLGNVPKQLLYVNPVETSQNLRAFGRGIHAYAYVNGSGKPVPAAYDGRYRTGDFLPIAASTENYTFVPNAFDQIIAGGDSGGPDHVMAADGVTSLGIAGVHSWCSVHYMPGMPEDWSWVIDIDDCTSAAIHLIRDDIIRRTREGLNPCARTSASCALPELAALQLLLP